MSDTDPDREEAAESEESGDQAGPEAGVVESVERPFTCSVCGFPMVHEAAPLRVEVSSIIGDARRVIEELDRLQPSEE